MLVRGKGGSKRKGREGTTVAFFFFFSGTDSTDSPSRLPIFPSVSVFTFFSFSHFVVFGSVL